ncbi:MAG TPA: putative zinc-binding metallopeptidase [Steroidobacteraceae bacterium]|nr:putative zinc-binding metallopeptidase [Steroidobacteraceae bacterium]
MYPTRAAGRSASAAHPRARPSTARRAARPWMHLSDEELLKVRFCDLRLSIERSAIARQVRRLYRDLERRGLRLRPHVWLAEEWFSPDGVPGIAVPFYLAHPRLERLERRIMGEAEGGNSRLLLRILRHEAGHALDNAYRLRRRKRWREVFGPASLPYPSRYRARAGSRRYVHHLGEWYAQAHPTEDFAETFAVWLTPKSAWRKNYAGWPALHKLQAVDELVASVRERRAPVRSRTRIEPLERNTGTLAQHYRRKLARNRLIRRGLADELLQRAFTPERPRKGALRAATLLRADARRLTGIVARALAAEPYSVAQILRMLIERSERLRLHVRGNRRDALRYSRWMLERLTGLYSQGETPHLPL